MDFQQTFVQIIKCSGKVGVFFPLYLSLTNFVCFLGIDERFRILLFPNRLLPMQLIGRAILMSFSSSSVVLGRIFNDCCKQLDESSYYCNPVKHLPMASVFQPNCNPCQHQANRFERFQALGLVSCLRFIVVMQLNTTQTNTFKCVGKIPIGISIQSCILIDFKCSV